MALHIPGKDTNLVVVVGHAFFAFGDSGQVLGNFLFSILHFIEHEKGDEALALGVLRNLERDVEIDQACQDPANTSLAIAGEPPVLEHGVGRFFVGGGNAGGLSAR